MIDRINFISGLSNGNLNQLKLFINSHYEIIYFLYDFVANGDYAVNVLDSDSDKLVIKLSNPNHPEHINSIARFLHEYNGKQSCGKNINIDILEQTDDYITAKYSTL